MIASARAALHALLTTDAQFTAALAALGLGLNGGGPGKTSGNDLVLPVFQAVRIRVG